MFEYIARLVRVVDGDTIDIQVDLGFYIHQEMRLRLRGIDTPEVRGQSRESGLIAKDFVSQRLGGAGVIGVRTFKIEKYGRFLADVYYGAADTPADQLFQTGTLLNRELVDQGMARETPEWT